MIRECETEGGKKGVASEGMFLYRKGEQRRESGNGIIRDMEKEKRDASGRISSNRKQKKGR